MDSIFRILMVGEASPLDSGPAYSLSVRAVCLARETSGNKETMMIMMVIVMAFFFWTF